MNRQLARLFSGVVLLAGMISVSSVRAEVRIAIDQYYAEIEPLIVSDFIAAYERIGEKPVVDIVPGARAVKLANEGAYDALDARFKSPLQLENLIPVEVPIYASSAVRFWGKPETESVADLYDLSAYRIVHERSSVIAERLGHEYGFHSFRVDSVNIGVRMLDSGRYQLLLSSDYYINRLQQLGEAVELVPKSEPLSDEWLYHHVHKRHADLVPKLEQAITELKAEGLFVIRSR